MLITIVLGITAVMIFSNVLFNNPMIQYFVVNVLHRSGMMTGRVEIYNTFLKIMRTDIWLGAGYDNTIVMQNTTLVGFDYERVIKTVQSYRKDIMFVFNYDYKTTGTIESLRRALKCARDIVITLDGDVILNEKDFQYFLQYENECIAVAQNASNEPIFADVINGQVVHLEKYESEGDFQWSGITKISRDKLLEFETERHEYDLLNRFMPLEACIVSLKEVNTQEDYESALSWFKNKLDQ